MLHRQDDPLYAWLALVTAFSVFALQGCIRRDGHAHFAPMALQPTFQETFVPSGQVLAADVTMMALPSAWVCAYRNGTLFGQARADHAGTFALRGAESRRVTHHTVSSEDHEHYDLTLLVGAPEFSTRSLTIEVPVRVDAEPLVIKLPPFDPEDTTHEVQVPRDCEVAFPSASLNPAPSPAS